MTVEQEAKYRQLLATVSAWTTIPSSNAKGAPAQPITASERMFLTRECLLRYLRAVKWNSVEAPRRLLATLTWRKEYGLEDRSADYVSVENETGKQVILGYDNYARPCIYLRPSMQNTQRSERQLQHLFFMLERVTDVMMPGQDAMAILIDFKNSNNTSNPSVAQGRQTLAVLQGHYPERLGRALITNVPWPVWGFFKLISPFIDPLTREKMKFNEDLRLYVPPSQLWSAMGGDVDFQYEHSIYWPALIALAAERREAYRERWVAGGERVGELEAYLKGGDQKSLSETEGPPSSDQAPASLAANGDALARSMSKEVAPPDVATLRVEP